MILWTFGALLVVLPSAWAAEGEIDSAMQTAAEAVVKSLDLTANPKVAVSALVSLGPVARDKQLGEVVAELLQDKLVHWKEITLIERVQLKKILEELKLSLLGLSDPTNAGAVGQMAGADLMIVGSVSEVGSSFAVALRVVEVSSGKIVKALKVKIPRDDMIALSSKFLVVRTKSDAIFRSLLVPGWGQMYNRDALRGALYTSVFAGSLAGAGVAYFLADQTKSDYGKIKSTDQTAMDQAAADYSSRRKLMNGLLIGAGAVWVINILDAAVTGVEQSEVKSGPQISSVINREGMSWQVAWNF